MIYIGVLASFLWGICLLPELRRTINHKFCFISWGTLALWIIASILSIIYTSSIKSYPLLANYSVNLLFQIIMVYYKIKYK